MRIRRTRKKLKLESLVETKEAGGAGERGAGGAGQHRGGRGRRPEVSAGGRGRATIEVREEEAGGVGR